MLIKKENVMGSRKWINIFIGAFISLSGSLFLLPGITTADGSGAFVATLLRAAGNNNFYFGGTVSPFY
jgi:hypothetical protein